MTGLLSKQDQLVLVSSKIDGFDKRRHREGPGKPLLGQGKTEKTRIHY